jgi:multicomponent Na+:H+ antiporter subunit G
VSGLGGTVQSVVAGALVVVGTLLIALAAVGMLRLPDFYNRANAVTKAASLGLVSILTGIMVLDPRPETIVLMAVAIVLQLITVPVAGYALGGAARRSGAPLDPATNHNDLAATPAPACPGSA